uniref:Uncharacterized protein n=1 Tax=Anguilla anguilla TaxID=7936 RepID=A0A0E9U6L3_ANGAN
MVRGIKLFSSIYLR